MSTMPPRPAGAPYDYEEGTSSTGRSDDCANGGEFSGARTGAQSIGASTYRTCASPCPSSPSKQLWVSATHVDCVPQLPPLPSIHVKGYPQKGSQQSLATSSSEEIAAEGASSHHQAEMPVKAFLSPPQIYEHVADAGADKLKNSFLREVVLGVMAGAYIGFGFSLCMLCAGQLSKELRTTEKGLFNMLFGIFGFPFGLTMTVLNGSSLFTSNVAYMMAAFIERKSSAWGALRIVWMSWITNFLGALLLGQLMIWGEVFHGREDFTIELAHKKTSYEFGTIVTRGILCNWLVCMAVWQANAAQDIGGKVLAIFLPISAFVAMGFEHCIANMYMIPLSMRFGSGITVGEFVAHNLIPATIGNLIGGAFFVATGYGLSFGAWEKCLVQFYRSLGGQVARACPKLFQRLDDGGSMLPTTCKPEGSNGMRKG